MSKKAKIFEVLDMVGQDVINNSYEKAWDKGKHKPSLKELNKDWSKVYGKGKDKKWKHLPKPDYKRGSGDGEGYSKLLREI